MAESEGVPAVLNVGGNNKAIPIPECFAGWRHDLLDIDPAGQPDIVCDARELWRLPPRTYDAVYCSHNLEHFYRHDVQKVLKGFRIVLKKNGFAFIVVPDIAAVMREAVDKGLDLDDVLYEAAVGPIMVGDVIYGYQARIERSGQDFFAHKTGFTPTSLAKVLKENGFPGVYVRTGNHEIVALAFQQEPSEFQQKLLGLPVG